MSCAESMPGYPPHLQIGKHKTTTNHNCYRGTYDDIGWNILYCVEAWEDLGKMLSTLLYTVDFMIWIGFPGPHVTDDSVPAIDEHCSSYTIDNIKSRSNSGHR